MLILHEKPLKKAMADSSSNSQHRQRIARKLIHTRYPIHVTIQHNITQHTSHSTFRCKKVDSPLNTLQHSLHHTQPFSTPYINSLTHPHSP
jgi:hypothetical protein